MLPPVRALLNQFRPPRLWWLGKPYRITIVTTGSGPYLRIHHTQGTEWVRLPDRTGPGDRSDDRERAAVAAALHSRGITWVMPWELGSDGVLTAPITTLTNREATR